MKGVTSVAIHARAHAEDPRSSTSSGGLRRAVRMPGGRVSGAVPVGTRQRQGLAGFTFLSTPFTRTVTFPRLRARSATTR